MANHLSPEDDPVNLLAARMNPNIAAQGAKARASMAPPTSIMDPRYPAWKKSQDDAELLMLMSDMALSAIPLAGPAARGAMATGRALAPTAGKVTENYLVRSGGILPMDTWHGTPHRFPPTAKNPLGEFDPMKIGTGEGAQAYGHGLYLAENPGVAKGYQKDVTRKLFDTNSILGWGEGKVSLPPVDSGMLFQYARGTLPPIEAAKKLKISAGSAGAYSDEKIADAITKIREQTKGNLYKVDLPDEQIAKMLDWDKPLSQQSKEIQDALARAASDHARMGKDFPKWESMVPANYQKRTIAGTTILVDPKTGLIAHPNASSTIGEEIEALRRVGDQGKVFYENLLKTHGGADGASQYLKSIGIPGIRYLDQGSRAGGKGTSNFVVFDPAHMNIIGRE